LVAEVEVHKDRMDLRLVVVAVVAEEVERQEL
jgi:hypothetical protein